MNDDTIIRVLGRPPNGDWGVINLVRTLEHKNPMERAQYLVNAWHARASDRLGYVADWQFKIEKP